MIVLFVSVNVGLFIYTYMEDAPGDNQRPLGGTRLDLREACNIIHALRERFGTNDMRNTKIMAYGVFRLQSLKM